MYWYLNICCLLLCLCYSSGTVHLNVVEKEIQLGKPLHLSCETFSDDIKGSRQWFGGKDKDTLCLNGVSLNSSKYNEIKLSPSKYQLKIGEVTENDLNCPYSCWFRFSSAWMILSVEEANFKHSPEEDTTNVKYVKESGTYSLQVRLEKVFPVPTCIAKTTPKPRNLTVVDKKRNGIFYAIHFSDESEEPFHSCGGPVEIECTIKDSKYTTSHQHSFECSGFNPTPNKNSAGTVIGIGIGTVILIVATIAVIIIYRKVQRIRNHRILILEAELMSKFLESAKSSDL